jgi:hypothetical protein
MRSENMSLCSGDGSTTSGLSLVAYVGGGAGGASGLFIFTPMDDRNPIQEQGFFVWKVSHPSPSTTHEVSIPQLLNVLFLGFLEVFNCSGLIAFGGCNTCFSDNQLHLESSHHDLCVFGPADMLPQLHLLFVIKII